MTQDKAPEWAVKMAEDLPIQGDGFCDDGDIQTIALALSQAYERGQESMRAALEALQAARPFVEAYDTPQDNPEQAAVLAQMDAAIFAIRSLPIEQEAGE